MEITENRLYTIEETAQMMQLSYDTIRRYIREGRLKCSRISATVVRISGTDLLEFYEAGKREDAK